MLTRHLCRLTRRIHRVHLQRRWHVAAVEQPGASSTAPLAELLPAPPRNHVATSSRRRRNTCVSRPAGGAAASCQIAPDAFAHITDQRAGGGGSPIPNLRAPRSSTARSQPVRRRPLLGRAVYEPSLARPMLYFRNPPDVVACREMPCRENADDRHTQARGAANAVNWKPLRQRLMARRELLIIFRLRHNSTKKPQPPPTGNVAVVLPGLLAAFFFFLSR